MEPKLELIWILAIGFGLAAVLGTLAQRLRLPPVLGYLLAGYFIGPHFPGYVADPYISQQLANIGVTLLMFAVGLNFRLEDLFSLNKLVLPGAIFLSAMSIAAGVILTYFLGASVQTGLVIGLAICVSSTVVLVRVFTDQNLLHTPQGHMALGWTIAEDVISVIGLIFMPTLLYPTLSGNGSVYLIAYGILLIFLKMIALVLIIYFVGEKLIEKTLKAIARTRSHELFTLAVLAWVFVIAVGSSYLFNVSIALGAFIAGTVVGKTEVSHQAAANAIPMRDAFAVLFFVSVGMLFDPVVVGKNLPLFIGILSIVLLLRPLLAFLIITLARYPARVAFTVALAISQIGEYSYIIAQEGESLHLLPENGYAIVVACSFITIAANPILFQIFSPFTSVRHPYTPSHKDVQMSELYTTSNQGFLSRVIVVGYGPIGKAATYYLLKRHYQVVVIDENIDTISSLRSTGIDAIFGDASQFRILERADIENTKLMVITVPEFAVAKAIMQAAQHLNPHVEIIARSHFSADLQGRGGDSLVVCDEDEASEKMVALIRSTLA